MIHNNKNSIVIFLMIIFSFKVYDGKKLAGHYMKSRAFLFDLAALIPLDALQLKFGPQPLLRFPRFLKVIPLLLSQFSYRGNFINNDDLFLFLFNRFIVLLNIIILLKVELYGQIYGALLI